MKLRATIQMFKVKVTMSLRGFELLNPSQKKRKIAVLNDIACMGRRRLKIKEPREL